MGKELSARIRSLRKKTPGRVIAAQAGITQAYFSQIELGQKEPSLNVLKALADALGTSVAYLMGDTEDPTPPSGEPTPVPPRKTKSAEMFDRLMKKMAEHSPDLVVHFRDLDENIDELEPEDIQALADGFAILTGMATKNIEKRMRRKSRHGEL